MGRSLRLFIAGGIYHVDNRVSHGEHVFRDEAEVELLLVRLVETKRRDGFQVLAWCLMSNHYHLALRMGEVARGLEKSVESASRLESRAATRRLEEESFRALVKAVDTVVIDQYGGE